MDRLTFSEAEYQIKKRKTHREIFLARMDKLIPWSYCKARYCGLARNSNRLHLLAALSNLLMGKKYLLA